MSISNLFSFPYDTSLLSRKNEQAEINIPLNIKGIVILYKLIPEAFIAVHSLSFTIVPKLKTVEINTDIGSAILVNHGNV